MLIFAAAIAAVVLASTANATGPISQGGDPKDPSGPISGELLPTPEETTAQALMQWLSLNPNTSVGGVRILDDHKTVVVYWKGSPPPALQDFASTLPVPVTSRGAAYSKDELVAAGHEVMRENPEVTSAAPSRDYSGVTITLSSKTAAPATTLTTIRAQSAVPIVLRGIEDINSLARTTSSATVCPVPARCGDQAPWFGGGLIRKYGVSGSACSIGASVYAGPYSYVTTAWHCGGGTWKGYSSGNTVGVGTDWQENQGHDIRVIPATSGPRIWTGNGYTTSSRAVYAAVNPADFVRVVCSCGASGSSLIAQYVSFTYIEWRDTLGAAYYPGFRVETYTNSFTGTVQPGDSGSPIIRSNSQGNFEVNGFLSGGVRGYETVDCQDGRHEGFDGPCYNAYYAANSIEALASMGLHLKLGA
ncbi:hypothetical protein ACWF0M_12715 [Kribbella sp. NPDC055110]